MKKTDQSKSMSRRAFLKGTATSAAGIAAASVLASCAPKTVATPAAAPEAITTEETKVSLTPEKAQPILPVSSPESWDYEADVVVVGGGGAGMAAAITAVSKGASVVLLEKNSFCGGDSSCAMTYGGLGTQFSQKLGIPVDTYANRMVKRLFIPNDTAGVNAEVARMLIEMEGETGDWLESIGVMFDPNPINNIIPPGAALVPIDPEAPEEGYYRWWPHNAKGITQALFAEATRVGVTVLMNTPASALVVDAGKVIGVKATNNEGVEVFAKGKAIILASGGFGANRDMIKAYVAPYRYESMRHWCLPSSTGDGIRMGQGVGAAIYGMNEILTWDGPNPSASEGLDLNYTTPSQLSRQKSLSVNKLGRRFFNEAAGGELPGATGYDYQAAQKMAQMDSTSFTLFDANCIKKEDIMKKFMPVLCEFPIPDWDAQFEKGLSDGSILQADSIEQLAEKMQIDPVELKTTVERYNELCAKGEDTDFFKPAYYLHALTTAPYYAVASVGGACFQTYGGLRYDNQLHVLDDKWNPIPGLFVAGENAHCMNTLMRVIPGGRIAGANAADEALS